MATLPHGKGRFYRRTGSFCSVGRDGHAKGTLVRSLCNVGEFVRKLRIHFRFGELSRAPLRLLRLELRDDCAECDWVARSADPWDEDLPRITGDRNASLQALQDAVAVRGLLLDVLPDFNNGLFRVYRQMGDSMELIIAGAISREDKVPKNVRSVAMRAKLYGLRFWLDEGVLGTLQPEEYSMSL